MAGDGPSLPRFSPNRPRRKESTMRKLPVLTLLCVLLSAMSSAAVRAVNLTNHGGPVITSAHVVFIFWGPNFNNVASADYNYARTLQSFRNQFGTTPEYNTITQYSGSNGIIALSNLAAGTADWFDTSTPPANVTDAI